MFKKLTFVDHFSLKSQINDVTYWENTILKKSYFFHDRSTTLVISRERDHLKSCFQMSRETENTLTPL